jgi:ATP-dependent Clp protease ATP-binding subunit ClpC
MNWFESAKEHLAKWMAQENACVEKLTPRALQVLKLARHEADRLKHNYVGTEHLLLGLIKLGNGVATNVLTSLGLNLEAVRLEIENRTGFGSEKMFGNIPFTPRVKRVLETAKKEADVLGHTYIGTEHLLLGLLQEHEGLAAQVFKHFNLDTEKTRKEILKEITPIFVQDNDEQNKST